MKDVVKLELKNSEAKDIVAALRHFSYLLDNQQVVIDDIYLGKEFDGSEVHELATDLENVYLDYTNPVT